MLVAKHPVVPTLFCHHRFELCRGADDRLALNATNTWTIGISFVLFLYAIHSAGRLLSMSRSQCPIVYTGIIAFSISKVSFIFRAHMTAGMFP
jgi:hypothetical protein